jgi:murein L,D-transpeptidase YcbB/YkuD
MLRAGRPLFDAMMEHIRHRGTAGFVVRLRKNFVVHIRLLRFVSLFLAALCASAAAQIASPQTPAVTTSIGTMLQSGAGIAASDLEPLRKFYTGRQNQPAWYDARGLNGDGKLAIAAIAASAEDGLDPAQYELANISKSLSGFDPNAVAYRELLLTAQVLHYASDLRSGRDNLKHVDADIDLAPSGFDVVTALSGALAERRLPEFLRTLRPQSQSYVALKAALARYRAIAASGGWPEVPVEKPFDEKSASAVSLVLLQNRLAIEDSALIVSRPPAVADVDAALRRFQLRNGLPGDGVVGPATLAVLNIPASARAAQIAANMERLRWLPWVPESSYVEVNVPDATLRVIDNGVEILTSRVIVGRPADRTPIFRAQITEVVANPPWIVPEAIARKEILPKVRKNPGYLARHDMVITNGQIRQLPGAKNALGFLKLNVTDRFSVYLHDTPSRSLFARDGRFLSHGCIRVQQITPLASYAMTGDITGGVDRLLSVIATGQTIHLPIKAPIPLYVDYFTVFLSTDGTLQFRPDIYGRDGRMIAAMSGTTFTQAIGSIGNCRRAA